MRRHRRLPLPHPHRRPGHVLRATDPRLLEAEILRGEPPRPSTVAKERSRARALRGDLDAIVLTALRREPATRYQSAGALAYDLEHYLAGMPVAAQPDRSLYRMRKFVARNALAVAAGAAIVVALGVGLAVALWQAQRATALNTFVLSLIRQADPNASQQTRAADLELFTRIAKQPQPESAEQIPMRVLIPAFVISELKTAFQIGFIIFIPFLIIDMVVASILMSMGMMMLPSAMISLPFKVILFVLVDGWYLVAGSLVQSFSPGG